MGVSKCTNLQGDYIGKANRDLSIEKPYEIATPKLEEAGPKSPDSTPEDDPDFNTSEKLCVGER